MKRIFIVLCFLLNIFTPGFAGYTQDVIISSEDISENQGENGWYYLMNYGDIFHELPKFTSDVRPTWRSGLEYPYVDGTGFYPSLLWNAVKQWKASESCRVDISGNILVSDKSSDGIIAEIRKNNQILWKNTVIDTTEANLSDIDMEVGDSLYFIVDANGSMKGDRTEWIPHISYERIFNKHEVTEYDVNFYSSLSDGVAVSGDYLTGFSDGASFVIKNVNLYDGYATLGVDVQANATEPFFEIRLDSANGQCISNAFLCNTDGVMETQYIEFDKTINGVHDLHFIAKGKSINKIGKIKLIDREPYGAKIPFVTVEAEESKIGGGSRIHNLSNYDVPQVSGDSRDGNNYSREQKAVQTASGKSYVDLNATGEYVSFTVPKDSNRMILRYTIPKNKNGTLNLYVNGNLKQTLSLSSKFNYDTNNYYLRSFDEKLITIDLVAGDSVMIRKDGTNTLSYYGIDLADFELIEEPIQLSDDWISIEEYGAVADDSIDDADAIESALRDAKFLGMDVYIPEGRFIQTRRIEIPQGVNIVGAGMWYSEIYFPTHDGGVWGGNVGYYIKSDSTVSDVMMSGDSRYRNDQAIALMGANNGDGNNCVIDNVWFRNITTAMGWTHWKNSTIQNCRFTGLYADAIHFGDWPQMNNIAYNNYIRGCGDDGVAVVIREDYSAQLNTKATGFTAQFNTVSAAYWGRGMSVVGGADVKYTNNVIDGSVNAGIIIATESLSPSRSVKNEKLRIQRNIIKRTSNRLFHHAGILVSLSYNSMADVRIEGNIISNTASSSIWIDNTNYGDDGNTQFNYNNVSNAGWSPAYRNQSGKIKPSFKENIGF